MIRLRMLWMGVRGFDRAKSNRVDSAAKQKPLGLGLPGRRSKKVTANAANDEVFALAA